MNKREQLKRAVELGIEVRPVNRTGEIELVALGLPPVRTSHPKRKREGTHAIEQLIRRVEATERKDQR